MILEGFLLNSSEPLSPRYSLDKTLTESARMTQSQIDTSVRFVLKMMSWTDFGQSFSDNLFVCAICLGQDKTKKNRKQKYRSCYSVEVVKKGVLNLSSRGQKNMFLCVALVHRTKFSDNFFCPKRCPRQIAYTLFIIY